MYGTIKTEVWANPADFGGEYFRFEIITRWWPIEKDSSVVTWETHIVRIDRNGKHFPTGEDLEVDNWWEYWAQWLKDNHIESMENGYGARTKMRAEHDFAIRMCIG